MAKKLYFGMSLVSLIAVLKGVSYMIEGITARGICGVNYGSVIFPLLLGMWALFRAVRTSKHQEDSE